MRKNECLDRLYILSVTAGVNQRYHQYLWTVNRRSDRRIRITVGVVAILGLVSSLLADSKTFPASIQIFFDILSLILGITALAVAAALNISSAGDKATEHRELFRRWSDLREEIDTTELRVSYLQEEKEVPEEIDLRIQELDAKKNRINAFEESPDTALLDDCLAKEEKARGARD